MHFLCANFSFRGFAFVHFNEESSVLKVLEAGDHMLDERTIDVKKAIPHAQHQVSPFPYIDTTYLYTGL